MARCRAMELAYKINESCDKPTCGRPSSYYFRRQYLCTKCFKESERSLARKSIRIIFPSYQEPQFPRVRSNMLSSVNAKGHIIGGNWGKRLRQGRIRRTSTKRINRKPETIDFSGFVFKQPREPESVDLSGIV